MRKTLLVLGIVILIIAGFFYLKPKSKNIPSLNPPEQSTPIQSKQITVIAENLDTPWGMVFLPDGSLLVTERPGRIRFVSRQGILEDKPIATLNKVREIGEGGLLGIALHPNFSTNNFIYLYYTYEGDDRRTFNRVVRIVYKEGKLGDEQIVVDNIPGAPNHNGGRIKFGPDKFLYITTGDAQDPSQAQNINSLSGKILRVTNEGNPAPGNPFNNLVYSYGHRNPQGLAWDGKNRLWATEHGRSGILSGLDELNLIEPGKNYGWPTIQGDEKRSGIETPRLHSGSDTWAPAGAAFTGDSLFFGGLRGQTLYETIIKGEQITLKEHFKGELGRIRDVVLGPDESLYITTSNQDGRGTPKTGDDKIIKLSPSALQSS